MIGMTRRWIAVDRAHRARGVRWPTARTILHWLLPLLIALALAAWEIGVRVNHTPKWFLPRPSAIGQEALRSHALLWRHTKTTLEEVLLGYVLALVLGVLLAVAIASSRIVERAVYP